MTGHTSGTLTRPRPGTTLDTKMMTLMPPTPPDLSRPYRSDADRAKDQDRLIVCWEALDALMTLSEVEPGHWTDSQEELVSTFPPAKEGVVVPPAAQADRLRRCTRLFADELSLIERTRDRLVHQDLVTDPELLGNTWLARQVLAAITGKDAADFIDIDRERLAKSIAARACRLPEDFHRRIVSGSACNSGPRLAASTPSSPSPALPGMLRTSFGSAM
jgi:hypothetical protein